MQVPGIAFEGMEAGELCGAGSAESPLMALNSARCDAWHWVPSLLPLRATLSLTLLIGFPESQQCAQFYLERGLRMMPHLSSFPHPEPSIYLPN